MSLAPFRYLLWPLRTAPLLLIVIFSVLLVLAQKAGLFGIPMALIIGSWFFKYAFVMLDYILDGRKEPPVLSAEMANPVEQRPLGIFFLLVAGYVLTGKLEQWLGPLAVGVLRLVLLCAVPAMVAAMSVTGRFADALNPVAVVGTIARIPAAYALLLFGIAALWFVPAVLLLAAGVHLSVGSLFGIMLFMYLWLAMFACIGGTLYEHRHELDIDAAQAPERLQAQADAALERERKKILDPILAEVHGNALANAGASVRRLIEAAPQPLEESRWIYAHVAKWSDQRVADYVAQLMLTRLLEQRATGGALQLVRDRLLASPSFRPQTAAQLLRMAELARDAGDRPTARRLLQDFEKSFTNDATTPALAQLRSQLER
jgi:hypothetical protein